jgi:MGT family glycosyltransferase
MLWGVLRNLGYLGRFRRAALELEKQYGVRLGGFVDALTAHGTITLAYTSALFQPGSDKLGRHVRYVGPLIAPRPHDESFPWERLSERKLIYISLGTLVNNNPDFFRTCVEAFSGQPYQVVLSIGDKVDPGQLGAIPENCLVRRSVPQLEILERAALFISHAGMNSVSESLYYGVPLLMAPQQQEQAFTATRVEQLGAGLRLRPPITPRGLLDAATLVLTDESFRSKAQRLRDSFHRAGGIGRAADEVLSLSARF